MEGRELGTYAMWVKLVPDDYDCQRLIARRLIALLCCCRRFYVERKSRACDSMNLAMWTEYMAFLMRIHRDSNARTGVVIVEK